GEVPKGPAAAHLQPSHASYIKGGVQIRALLDQSSRTVLFLIPPSVVPFNRIRKSMLSPNP
ncbi:MAG: hypothetical protein KAT30_02590, partial [Candidatus Krumholzibacteria bacterium]|nr:hypothetical protein [Candidatus Krumholzibacteria bacterium]